MNRAELMKTVADEMGINKNVVTQVLDTAVDVILNTLLNKEEVKLGLFGKFVCIEKDARKGRNPKTGEDVDIPAKTVVKFKAGKAVKDLF